MVEINKWLSSEFETFLSSCTNFITQKIGAEHVKSVSLVGSFATGEGTVVSIDDTVVFLSDLDIIVVVDSLEVLKRVLPLKRKIGIECEKILGPMTIFIGHVDVGVITLSDLEKLPPSPGNLLMKSNARVLWGDEKVFERIHLSKDVPHGELERLLENRIVLLLAESSIKYSSLNKTIDKYRYLYAISKVYTDIALALVISSAGYMASYKERYDFLNMNHENEETMNSFLDNRLLNVIRWATEYKLAPSLEGGFPFENIGNTWEITSKDILSTWLKFKGFMDGIDSFININKDIDKFLTRKSSHGMIDNLRLWRAFFKRRRWAGAIPILLGRNFSLLSIGPGEVIRNEAVRLLFERLKIGGNFKLKAKAGGFPFMATSFEDAARELYKNWDNEVHGG